VTADAVAHSPFERRAGDLIHASDALGPLDIVEVPFLAQVGVRVAGEHAVAAAVPLPLEPNTVGRAGDRDLLWLGPDEWLAVGPPGAAPDMVRDLEAGLRGAHRSIVDLSAARAVVELRGPGRHGLLAKGCSLDLAAPGWAPGRCAQTLLGRVQVILQEKSGSTRVFVRPSFGDYLVDWFVDATEEYRITGAAP